MGVYDFAPNPCRECEDRKPKCHAKCERHKTWKEQLEARKETISKSAKEQRMLDSMDLKRNKRIHDARKLHRKYK